MTIRIVRTSRSRSDTPQAVLALAGYALAYLAWTDWRASSLRGSPDWVLAILFGAAAAAGVGSTNLGVAALAVGFTWVPGVLGGRLHLSSMGLAVLFAAACLAADRAPSGLRRYIPAVLAACLAAAVNWGSAPDLGSILLGTAAALPSIWVLFRSEERPAPALFLAKMSMVLLAGELLRSTILPWNGVRGRCSGSSWQPGRWLTAYLVGAVTRASLSLDGFSRLAYSTGGLLVLAVGRRLHDPESARNLLLMGAIATDFDPLHFPGVESPPAGFRATGGRRDGSQSVRGAAAGQA